MNIENEYQEGRYTNGLQVYGQGRLTFMLKNSMPTVQFRALNKQDFMERMEKISEKLFQ